MRASNKSDFEQLALMRLQDAKVLLANGRNDAAYYMAGYGVECALKACIAEQTLRFPQGNRDIVLSKRPVGDHEIERGYLYFVK